MGGTKGCEAVSSVAGISLCDAPLWCGLVCDYRMGRRLSRTRLFYGCPLLRSRIFPFFGDVWQVTFDYGRRRRRGARAARLEGEGGPGRKAHDYQGARPATTTGRKARRLDLIELLFIFPLSPLSPNNYFVFSPFS